MRITWSGLTLPLLAAVVLSGAGTESRAQYARRTPIVEAVQKTRNSIVTIRVEKHGSWGRKEIVGTGVIVDERGYVVTNHHVVSGADHVAVHLADGTEVNAQIHTEDSHYDLAILRLPGARKLSALTFSPSSDLMVGETVIAVGHPFGYTNTVSTGIVSALGREITMPAGEQLTNLIQTNASINPGNSGGPLLNINGELIGINVALREGAQGIAFALTSEMVEQVLARHLSAGRVARIAHGLTCREAIASEVPERQRVFVEGVAASSPAERAGLRSGDVIVRVADRTISNRFDLERSLWSARAGDWVGADILRDGRERHVNLALVGVTGADLVSPPFAEPRPRASSDNAQPAKIRR